MKNPSAKTPHGITPDLTEQGRRKLAGRRDYSGDKEVTPTTSNQDVAQMVKHGSRVRVDQPRKRKR